MKCERCIHSGMCKMEIAPNWDRENCTWSKPTADVAPRAEVDRLKIEVDGLKKDNEYILMQHRFQRRPSGDCWNDVIEKAKAEVVAEIFADIEKCRVVGVYGIHAYLVSDIAELKKKYTQKKG